MAEAEKALNKTSFLGIFGVGKAQKYEDAADLFIKAGNAYKLAQEFALAGGAFRKAAENQQKADGSQNDMIKSIEESGNCYKMGLDHNKAVDAYNEAIMYYEESQRYGLCAKLQKDIAEMYESVADYSSAVGCYQKVIRYFLSNAFFMQ